jgi:hypothetical protein
MPHRTMQIADPAGPGTTTAIADRDGGVMPASMGIPLSDVGAGI